MPPSLLYLECTVLIAPSFPRFSGLTRLAFPCVSALTPACTLKCALALCRQGGIEEAASSTVLPVQVNQRPAQAPPQQQQQQQAPRPPGNDPKKREEFYANIGDAIRTLKKEIPQLFQKDLTCKSSQCSCIRLLSLGNNAELL